ncbi:MAG: SDR family oxidoreductase [Gemmatimonadaceae bacterium]
MTIVLRGRSAVVTGASRGIGRAVARSLSQAGARVVLLARNAEALHATARELTQDALTIPCDVADPESVATAVERTRAAVGTPDILVNNAGRFSLSLLHLTEDADFSAAVATNLSAPFLLVKAFLGAMLARGGGHIVTIGSIADRTPFPENAAYAATKFGVRALHEVLREETRGSGVRATLVSPGPVDTPLWDPVAPDTRPGYTPRSAMLSADAVADAVTYVVTRDASVNIDELRLSRA